MKMQRRKKIPLLKLFFRRSVVVIFGTCLGSILPLFAQSNRSNQSNQVNSDQGHALAAVDSARREISKKILSPADKKNIRSCDRGKMDFLKICREGDPENQSINKSLNEAKMSSANPEDPAIQVLLEKKFTLEKKCDDKYQATSVGKTCVANEAKRQSDLEKALTHDKAYQLLLKKVQPVGSEPL